jgi:hypothetical protein
LFDVVRLTSVKPVRPLAKPPAGPAPRKEGLINHEELRDFLGRPRQKDWKLLLKEARVELRWSKSLPAHGGRNIPHRCGLNRNQVMRVLRARYASLGEHSIRRWKL